MSQTPAKITALLLAGTSLTATDLQAQTLSFALEEIVFSAQLTPVDANRTGIAVEQLSFDDIAADGQIKLSDQLVTLPGVTASANGGLGSATAIRIRGLDTDYIPVFINGIDVSDPASSQTSFNFGALTGAGLGRVEILKGSQSALYGSEAIAGVVDISTSAVPDDPGTRTRIGVEIGSFNTISAQLAVGLRSDRTTLSFSAARTVSDGFSAAEENTGNSEADGFRSTTLTFGATYQLTEALLVGFDTLLIDSFTEQDGFSFPVGPVDDPGSEDATRRGTRIFAQFDAFGVDHELSAQTSRTKRFYPTGFTTNFNGERDGLKYQGSVEVGQARYTLGAETSRERFTADASSGEYRINSVFGEYGRALGDQLDLALSLRHDDHSVYGGSTTGRVALAWRPNDATVLRASYGTGFRAPSLYELYSFYGNPSLRPEQSKSAELGIDYAVGSRARVSGTVFRTEIDDLIGFGAATYVQVLGKSVTKGVEVSGEYDLTDALTLFGNYTYTDAKDRTGARIVRVPMRDLTIGLVGNITERVGVHGTVQRVMDRLDTTGAVPDYTLANLQITYAINDMSQAYLRVENLFDEEYQTAAGYGTSDRALYFGVRADF